MTLLVVGLLWAAWGGWVLGYSNSVIDLDDNKDNVDLPRARLDGIHAVIHAATRGNTYTDYMYAFRLNKTKEMGNMLWGAFHYGISGSSGAEQANHFLETVGNTNSILLALNLDRNIYGRTMPMSAVQEFVETVKNSSHRCPVLMVSYDRVGVLNGPAFQDCPLWVKDHSESAAPRLPSERNKWSLWQYTDGILGGNPQTVDGVGKAHRSKYNGALASLISKWPHI